VIVGNRNAGKRIMAALITVLLAMLLITVLVTVRRRSAPLQEPPLHPSVLLVLGSRL